MKTHLACFLIAALATPVAAGPDFAGEAHRNAPLAASDMRKRILPSDDLAFATGSYALLSSSVQQIERAARWLRQNPRHRIVLEGHASSPGSSAYNEELATQRAEMVRSHLIGRGIPSDRIVLVVFGEARAKADPSPIDQRVVMYATDQPVHMIARSSLSDTSAVHVMWTHNGVLFTETHGVSSPEAGPIATR